jgi:hypothetical protein
VRRIRIIGLALVATLVLAACNEGNDPAEPAGAEASGPAVTTGPTASTGATGPTASEPTEEPASGAVTYTAVDYGFDGPSELAAGDVEITLENEGTEPHELVLFPVAEGTSVEDVLTYLEENPDSEEIPDFVLAEPVATFARPGRESRRPLVATLEPGTYMMMCFVTSKENDGLPHAMLGMIREVSVA